MSDRDRDRDRDTLPRCNTDPSTADSRIYVGNLPEQCSRESLYHRFLKFGNVKAVSVFRGYGFVQFSSVKDAEEAIKKGADDSFMGREIHIREAVTNKTRGDRGDRGGPRGPPEWVPDRPDWRDYPDDDRKRRRPDDRWPHDRRPPGRFEDGDRFGNGFDDRFRGPPARSISGPPARYDDMGPRGPPPPPAAFMPRPRPAAVELERANDCEIVVLDRKNRMYAEEVEDRLKQIGLAVDMLFPRSGAPINVVLDQISSRGTLYAVVIHPTNEQHRSVSLNIMHGNPPQEHRNMPLEDAMNLVARNFEAYIISNKGKAPPQGIINLLDFVKENRPLTAMEYNRLIKYLEEKRDFQLKPDKTSLSLTSSLSTSVAPRPVPVPAPVAPVAPVATVTSVAAPTQQQLDLQQKILSMMQAYKTQSHTIAVGTAPVSVTVPVPAPIGLNQQQQVGLNQQQPAGQQQQPNSVNRALDSLITSGPNLLKVEQTSQRDNWYAAQASSLGQAPANPLFGAYANQRF